MSTNPQTPQVPFILQTPRERFAASQVKVATHRSMIDTPAFGEGADAALLEYTRQVSGQVKEANSAMCAGLKIQGAAEFLQVFKTLAEPPPKLRYSPQPNLTPEP